MRKIKKKDLQLEMEKFNGNNQIVNIYHTEDGEAMSRFGDGTYKNFHFNK